MPLCSFTVYNNEREFFSLDFYFSKFSHQPYQNHCNAVYTSLSIPRKLRKFSIFLSHLLSVFPEATRKCSSPASSIYFRILNKENYFFPRQFSSRHSTGEDKCVRLSPRANVNISRRIDYFPIDTWKKRVEPEVVFLIASRCATMQNKA